MSESDFQKEALKYLQAHAKILLVWATDGLRGIPKARNVRSRVGVSDLCALTRDGRFVAVELKVPDGTKRPKQIEFISKAKSAGAIAGFCESILDIERLLA